MFLGFSPNMFCFPNKSVSQVSCLYITSLVFLAIINNSALHLLLLHASSVSKNLCCLVLSFLLLWGFGEGRQGMLLLRF